MKKKIGVFFIVVASLVLIIFSYMSWSAKINNTKENATKNATVVESAAGDATSDGKKEVTVTDTVLDSALANSSADVQKLFQKRYDDDKKVNMLILGSKAMNDGGEGYAALLKKQLQATYGDFVIVTAKSFDTTSYDFVANHLNDVEWSTKYDLILLEPFTFKDSGVILPADEFQNIDEIVAKAQKAVKDAVVVIQPPFPAYGAHEYKTNISALKSYAKSKGLTYFDHWSKWPGTNDKVLKNYLTADNKHPNEQGAKLWAGALSDYFTAQ
jgi:lysophospholipase L1-like esterase